MKQWDIFLFPYPTPDDPHLGGDLERRNLRESEYRCGERVAVPNSQTTQSRQKGQRNLFECADGLIEDFVKCDFVLV